MFIVILETQIWGNYLVKALQISVPLSENKRPLDDSLQYLLGPFILNINKVYHLTLWVYSWGSGVNCCNQQLYS